MQFIKQFKDFKILIYIKPSPMHNNYVKLSEVNQGEKFMI